MRIKLKRHVGRMTFSVRGRGLVCLQFDSQGCVDVDDEVYAAIMGEYSGLFVSPRYVEQPCDEETPEKESEKDGESERGEDLEKGSEEDSVAVVFSSGEDSPIAVLDVTPKSRKSRK